MAENLSEQDAWNRVIAAYKATLASDEEKRLVDLHFPQFLSHRYDGKVFRIGVAEEFQREWFSQMYAKPLEKAIEASGLGNGAQVAFEVQNLPGARQNIVEPPPRKQETKKENSAKFSRALPSTLPLHENYIFENFVRGPSNSFAYAAAIAVAKGLGKTSYNPLFIWGGTGLGKTHLMEAIGHRTMKNNPEKSVCYITSETFLNEYVNAIASATLPIFRSRYRKYDLLLLDDVQFIVGKKQFQEEFFNTINQLLIYNKQVVMTCDVAPAELQLEQRLISRFQQGMVVEIESPSYETRLAILKSKMQARNRNIPPEILNYIAENICSHVRAIEGALSRIITFMEINPDMPPTIEIAQHLLKDMIEEEVTIKNITPDAIIQATAEYYGVSIAEIKAPGRTQALVTPRQMAMFLTCKLTTDSLKEIGNAFDRKHTTVYWGSQQIQKRISVEPELKNAVAKITEKLGRKANEVLEE